jgi:hypothetical protein
MFPKLKLPIIVFIIAAICLSIWVFFIFKQRNSSPADNSVQKTEQQQTQNEEQLQTNSSDQKTDDTSSTTLPNSADNSAENSSDENAHIEKTNFIEVSSKDCDNNCKNYKDKDELKYCQNFCGLNIQKEDTDDCADLESLEADYCFKDLAISKKDYALCDKISDAGILKTCRNRITEDILDSQK